MTDISASVGVGGSNQAGDVRMVQRLLNDYRSRAGRSLLKVDGVAGPLTNAAITEYQTRRGLTEKSPGRLEPAGATIRQLQKELLQGIAQGVVPFDLPSSPRGAPDLKTVSELQQRIWDALKK
jgi:peptidoglycan hydrolase-like protein with peptidoglycan-binding domain